MREPGLALITGASAGIGAALAVEFARHGHSLVLVARNEERLRALAQGLREEHGVRIEVVSQDLGEPGSARLLQAALLERHIEPSILVNNAGVGAPGAFEGLEVEDLEQMVRLNVEALTSLTSLLLPPMLREGYGRILNVSSVAAFQPVPAMAVYAATKAYVLSMSEALGEELQGSGVRVACLCPGLTDTEMATDMAELARSGGEEVPRLVMSTPTVVAREGYDACMNGEAIRVPGPVNQVATLWSQTQPRWLLRTLGGVFGRQLLRRRP